MKKHNENIMYINTTNYYLRERYENGQAGRLTYYKLMFVC